MYFATIFSFAALATSVAYADCGVWYDNYLGPGSAGSVIGDGVCQSIQKSGESPNDGSQYTFLMKGQCIHCNFYSDDSCKENFMGVGHDAGNDWDIDQGYSYAKSFSC